MTLLDAYGKHSSTRFDIEPISDELLKQIQEDIYRKPDKRVVVNEMRRIMHGYDSIAKVTDYYFRDLMWDCLRYDAVYSVNEVMHDKMLASYIYYIVHRRDEFYKPEEQGYADSFRKFFAMGGKPIGGSVAQFPLKTANYILDNYNVNNEYYDFSCGWGCRLTSAMAHNINYYGTDPNYKLIPILQTYADDWEKECGRTSTVNLYCQGSEKFIPELENKIGLAFSSTPYFHLEDYIYGEQSCRNDTYDEWVDNYLRPTIENIAKYLIDEGYFLLNIKDYDNYPMEADVVRISEENGFELEKVDDLNMFTGSNRPKGNGEYMTTTEPIFVFHKKGFIPKPLSSEKEDLW